VVALLDAGKGEAGVHLHGLAVAWPLKGWVSASPMPSVWG
jgi:hypothetical protein